MANIDDAWRRPPRKDVRRVFLTGEGVRGGREYDLVMGLEDGAGV
ncbi:hypothetical protein GCM10017690_08330 [Microbacterium terregens]